MRKGRPKKSEAEERAERVMRALAGSALCWDELRRTMHLNDAIKLKNEGLLDYKRGHINVVDKKGMEAHTCECYQIIKRGYERLYRDLSA